MIVSDDASISLGSWQLAKASGSMKAASILMLVFIVWGEDWDLLKSIVFVEIIDFSQARESLLDVVGLKLANFKIVWR